MKRGILLSVSLTVTVMPSVSLLADGGYFFYLRGGDVETIEPSQTRQEVALAFYRGDEDGLERVTYVLKSTYSGDANEFAWVIPVPATPTDVVAHEDESFFESLDIETQPTFRIVHPISGRPSGGCGCSAAPGAGQLGLEGDVAGGGTEVEARGQAGIFEWVALTSTGGDSLLDWLNENDFAVPDDAAEVLDQYIQDDWHFLALRITDPEQVEPGGGGEIDIPPIQFTCQTSRRVYPMVISQVSAADRTEVIVYIVGNHRGEAANLANVRIDADLLEYDPDAASQTNYEILFDLAIAEHDGLALITEYAQPRADLPMKFDALPEAGQLTYLTRLRTIIAQRSMLVDFEFRDAPTDEEVLSDFTVSATSADAASLIGEPLAGLLIFSLAGAAMKRRFQGKAGGVAGIVSKREG